MTRYSMNDRRVHAVLANGGEVVRYDRAGAWYLENGAGQHSRITLAGAVSLASGPGATVHLGLPGGGRFDAAVRREAA